jgi:N utilization substance protein A
MRELTSDDLNYFSQFERITGVTPNDYMIISDTIVFLVGEGLLGKAIGRNSKNIEMLKDIFKKRIIIIADSNEPELFLRNIFYKVNILATELREAGGEKKFFLTIDENDRGIAIGKNGERIKMARTLLKKKFNMDLVLRTRRVI